MSVSGRSVAFTEPSVHQEYISPPVSRAEVSEVFDSWRNSAGHSEDSGVGQASSSQSGSQQAGKKVRSGPSSRVFYGNLFEVNWVSLEEGTGE